jgi:PhnB protein
MTTHVQSLTPYLIVDGAAAAIDFYVSVFGAREIARYTEGGGRLGHAELSFGGHVIHLADEYPEYGMRGPRAVGGVVGGIALQVADADAVVAAAEAAGARVLQAVREEFHGERSGRVEDPWGHVWSIRATTKRVPVAELVQGWTEMAAGNTAVVKPPVTEVGYYTLTVPDVSRGRAFYGAVFGWEFGATADGQGGTYAHVENVRLPLGLTGDRTTGPKLYYRVQDIDAEVARVRAHGGAAGAISESRSGRGAECTDDQGVAFALWEPAAGF